MTDEETHEIPIPELPLELRAGLDVIARETGGAGGEIRADVIGNHNLIRELARYARISPSSSRLILLMAPPDLADATMEVTKADEIWTLSAGPLAQVLRPLRANVGGGVIVTDDLSGRQWHGHGFDRIATIGIQGIGSVAWAAGERLCRKLDRPDFADRCRIGMLRTLLAARPLNLAAVRIQHFRRRQIS